MIKKVKIIKENETGLTEHLDEYLKADVVFRKIRQDY